MPKAVALTVRGRGTRWFPAGKTLVVSEQGLRVPLEMPVATVRSGDWVGIEYGGEWADQPALLPKPPSRPRRGSEKAIIVPHAMTDGLAFLLGAYFSEGHTTRSNWSVILTNSVMDILVRARSLV